LLNEDADHVLSELLGYGAARRSSLAAEGAFGRSARRGYKSQSHP
jgi:hypothetical protein